jgi:DNA-binding MarR family transcriptional regulator
MTDFVESLGPAYFGHVLNRLADHFARGFEVWHKEVGLIAPARTFSTLRFLDQHGPSSVTELSEALRQSHPLIITWLKSLQALDLVSSAPDANDRRRTVISLTERGKVEVAKAKKFQPVTARAFQSLFDESDADIFEALWRIEKACRRKSFADRLRDQAAAPPS